MTPEARRIAVFSRGTSRGFRGLTPVGGHWPPSSGVACFVGSYSSSYNLKFGGGKANSELICIITE